MIRGTARTSFLGVKMINPAENGVDLGVKQDLDEAFRQHFGEICRRTYYLTGNRAVAEELAQEAFLKLWEKPPKQPDNISGWLHRVATNLSFNHLRKEKIRQSHTLDIAECERAIVHIDDQVGRNLQATAVRKILDSLTPRERMLLLLKNEGMSYREIGEALEIEEASVGSLLLRARRRFKELYQENYGGEV